MTVTYEEKIAALRRLYHACPDVLTPYGVAKWTHKSKNTIYGLIKTGTLAAYPYHGKYLIAKEDLIEYMARTSDGAVMRFGKQ